MQPHDSQHKQLVLQVALIKIQLDSHLARQCQQDITQLPYEPEPRHDKLNVRRIITAPDELRRLVPDDIQARLALQAWRHVLLILMLYLEHFDREQIEQPLTYAEPM